MTGTGANGLALDLNLPTRTDAGRPVEATLTLTNRGDAGVTLLDPRHTAALNLAVFDRYWDQVAPESVGKAHVAPVEVELVPGGAATFVLDDLVFTTGTAQMRFELVPGTYHVVAIYHPGTARLPAESTYPIVVASEVRTLVVE